MKEIETIGRIDHPSGRSYKILELLNTETGAISLEGEQLQPFSSGIVKAIQSGYALKDCADEVLRGTWRRLAEKNAVYQSDIPGDEAGDTPAIVPEAPPQEYPESDDVAPLAGRQPYTDEAVPEDARETSAGVLVAAQVGDEATVVTEVSQAVVTTHLRDRRSPESPASESIRLQIAARDRETDRLQATFAHHENHQAPEAETVETGSSDIATSHEPDLADMDNRPAMSGPEANVATQTVLEPAKVEPVKAQESKPAEPANPFALF